MNSKNSKTSHPHRLLIRHYSSDEYVALSSPSIC